MGKNSVKNHVFQLSVDEEAKKEAWKKSYNGHLLNIKLALIDCQTIRYCQSGVNTCCHQDNMSVWSVYNLTGVYSLFLFLL